MSDRDRFRYQRYRFQPPAGGGGGFPGLTPMVQRLMIINAVVFLAQEFIDRSQGYTFTSSFALQPLLVLHHGYFWQPFTYMWLHGGLMHILFNMFALWMFGGQLEQAWGSRRFLRFYLQCGIGSGFIILFFNWAFAPQSFTLGASGAIYGLLLAFSLTWPDRTIMLLFPPMPIKAIWFIPVLFALTLLMGGGGNVSHIGHLGGVLVAAVLMRDELRRFIGMSSLRHRWHRWRMRNRLKAVRREDWEKRKRDKDDESRFH